VYLVADMAVHLNRTVQPFGHGFHTYDYFSLMIVSFSLSVSAGLSIVMWCSAVVIIRAYSFVIIQVWLLPACRVNMGTADELSLDILINALYYFSRE
jgi:hypothetical protein